MADLFEEMDSAAISADAASGSPCTHPSDVGLEHLLLASKESGDHQPPHPLLDEVIVEREVICSHEAGRGSAAGEESSQILPWGTIADSRTCPGSVIAKSDESPTQRELDINVNDNTRNGKRRKMAKLGVPIEPTLSSEVLLQILISLIIHDVHARTCLALS